LNGGVYALNERTADNVHRAFVEEAKAHERLLTFAMGAEEEGFHQIAHLFRAVAASEGIHARRHFAQLESSIGDTEENLERAFHSETGIAGVEYQSMMREAYDDEENAVALVFSQIRDVEDSHAKLYKKALDHLIWERKTTYFVCGVCGYVSDGGAPENCPICGADSRLFRNVD
jgi:rubrerythrin